MVSLECGQAAKGTGVRNVFPSSCRLLPVTFLLLRSNRKPSYPGYRFLSFRHKKYRGGGVLPYKRLMGMCRWIGSHFHDWIDYNGVTLSIFRFLG